MRLKKMSEHIQFITRHRWRVVHTRQSWRRDDVVFKLDPDGFPRRSVLDSGHMSESCRYDNLDIDTQQILK